MAAKINLIGQPQAMCIEKGTATTRSQSKMWSFRTSRLLEPVAVTVGNLMVALKRLQAETSAELDAPLLSVLDRAFKGEL